MSTFRFRLFILVFAVLGVTPSSLQAQRPRITGNMIRKACVTPVSVHSWRINQAALKKLSGLIRPATHIQAAQAGFPEHVRRQVFQVKRSPSSHSTASAFALNINGRVWGVTAGHVMRNILLDPHMVVKNSRGKLITAPITFQHMSNTRGSDVAIFEIPKELLPYIEVLQPADKIPAPQTVTQSPCFIQGNPFYLPSEDVLFAGPHRLLLRDQAHREVTGYCGSPVLVNGKVVAVHVGAYSLQDLQTVSWSSLLTDHNIRPQAALHVATPIQRVEELANQVETVGSLTQTGTPLKVMGNVVTQVQPQEYVFSIQLLRNGMLLKSLHTHPFMNFDKLEEFFDLQENDVLRITILSPRNVSKVEGIKIYDVDISTGKVIQPNL